MELEIKPSPVKVSSNSSASILISSGKEIFTKHPSSMGKSIAKLTCNFLFFCEIYVSGRESLTLRRESEAVTILAAVVTPGSVNEPTV
jgi:hypothetical protein